MDQKRNNSDHVNRWLTLGFSCLILVPYCLAEMRLSQARSGLAATATDRYIFFGGGFDGIARSNVVDIYDTLTTEWTTAKLSVPRTNLAATSVGNYVIFGGGQSDNKQQVYDIIDTSTSPWTWTSISSGRQRAFQGATTAGQFALFSGGLDDETSAYTDIVDIFDSSNNTWSTARLSIARFGLSATSNGTTAMFAGGYGNGIFHTRVDMFDANTLEWKTSELSQGRTDIAATSVGKYALFAHGLIHVNRPTNLVDIYDYSNGIWSTGSLKKLEYTPIRALAVSIGKYALFGGDPGTLEVFQEENGQFSEFDKFLSFGREDLAAASTDNVVLFGGGRSGSYRYDTVDLFSVDFVEAKISIVSRNTKLLLGLVIPIGSLFVAGFTWIGIITYRQRRKEYLRLEQYEFESVKRLNPSNIPFNEISLFDKIGEGTYGEIYKAKVHGQVYAVKKTKTTLAAEVFNKEAATLISLRHQHIVLSTGVSKSPNDDVLIVMEYMKNGSLYDLLFDDEIKLNRKKVLRLALDIAKGLNYLHSLSPKVIHRDLKGANVLLYQNKKRAKLSDFGTARVLNGRSAAKTVIGTLHYIAPEILEEKDYDESVDVYSFGVLLYEMLTNTYLPIIMAEEERIKRISESIEDPQFKQLVIDCCRTDPKSRPSIRECIEILKEMKNPSSEVECKIEIGN